MSNTEKGEFVLYKVKEGILRTLETKDPSTIMLEYKDGVLEIEIRFRKGTIPEDIKTKYPPTRVEKLK